MTIGAWICCILIDLCILAGCVVIGVTISYEERVGELVGAIIGLICSILVIVGMHWYYQNTASGARALKSQESNLKNGIERQIIVYDINGNIIEEYEGKFDLEYDNDRILFDDENDCRHIIFYTTGTIVINEKEKR